MDEASKVYRIKDSSNKVKPKIETVHLGAINQAKADESAAQNAAFHIEKSCVARNLISDGANEQTSGKTNQLGHFEASLALKKSLSFKRKSINLHSKDRNACAQIPIESE